MTQAWKQKLLQEGGHSAEIAKDHGTKLFAIDTVCAALSAAEVAKIGAGAVLLAQLDACLKDSRALVPLAYNATPTHALNNQLGNLIQEWTKVYGLVKAALSASAAVEPVDAELLAALKPFAKLAGLFVDNPATDRISLLMPNGKALTVAHLRKASKAIQRAESAQPAAPGVVAGVAEKVCEPLSDAQLEELRKATFSTDNPFCPCDSKTFRKAAWAVERAHGIVEVKP